MYRHLIQYDHKLHSGVLRHCYALLDLPYLLLHLFDNLLFS